MMRSMAQLREVMSSWRGRFKNMTKYVHAWRRENMPNMFALMNWGLGLARFLIL